MPQIQQALISFGQLVALLDANGVVRWVWFGDPKGQILAGIPANRAHLGKLIRALLDRNPDDPDQPFAPDLVWEPINFGENVGAGFVWNTTPAPTLQLGFGAKANLSVANQAIDLALLARLLKFQSGNATAELGNILFSGKFPVPDFLKSASLTGSIPPPAISLTVEDASARQRTVALSSSALAWDCVRLAVFVVQAWVDDQAATQPASDGFFQRVDEHFFPMLGEPESDAIKAFPLFGEKNMGKAPDFDAWKDSVLTTNNNAAGALTFLWHLRALLTGKEDTDFLEGSFFFPLHVQWALGEGLFRLALPKSETRAAGEPKSKRDFAP